VHNQKTNQALLALGNRQDARHIRQAIEFSMPMRMTFAELMAQYTPSADIAGMHAWCTDYPSVGGFGAEVVCTGSRWKSISQQHCLLSPPSAVAGTLFAVGAAEAVYGSVVKIPAGVLSVDDNIRIMYLCTHPTISTGTRSVNLRLSTTEAGIIAGASINGMTEANSSNNSKVIEKVSTLTSETNVRRSATSLAGAAATSAAQVDVTVSNVTTNDLFAAVTVAPSADTSILMFAASVYVEFAR